MDTDLCGVLTGDQQRLYFCHFDKDNGTLWKQERETTSSVNFKIPCTFDKTSDPMLINSEHCPTLVEKCDIMKIFD